MSPRRFAITGPVLAAPGPAPALPGALQTAFHAARAATRLARRLVTGQPLRVSPEEQARRRALCTAPCPFYRRSESSERCARCGCRLGGRLVHKLELASEHCPDGRW